MQSFIKTCLMLLAIALSCGSLMVRAQGNCEAIEAGSKQRRACEYGRKAITFKQGSRQSQLLFDSAIATDPDYAWAWYEKSVPYLKRGMLSEGMQLLNRAVELDPLSYLTYRAYWFFQHQSYEQCRKDLERFYAMEGTYQKSTPGGALDMRMVLGLNYHHTGSTEKAIALVEETIENLPSEDYVGPYDHHTLGVLYLKKGEHGAARAALMRSIKRNEQFADTYYYLALVEELLGDMKSAKFYINEAMQRYKGQQNGYTGYPFCFPVSAQVAEQKMRELTNQKL